MGCRPSDTHTVGLHDDGTVESTSSGDTHSASLANTRVWENIIVIEAGYNCTYGINRNREVVSTQESSIVKRWSGIVDLAAGNYDHGIIGLSIHGNLTPENSFLNVITINGAPNIEQKSINDWEGIIKIVANKYIPINGKHSLYIH